MTPLFVVLGWVAYLFAGAVIGGVTQRSGERNDGFEQVVWLAGWPLWLALMGVVTLTRRGFALGQRLNPELRVELRAEAARELARTIERLEREERIGPRRVEPDPPSGSLTPPPAYRVTDKRRLVTLTQWERQLQLELERTARRARERANAGPPSSRCDCSTCREYRRHGR